MRRVHPAYPDLLPVTHAVRPGFLPMEEVTLDPIRMAVVWQDAPRRFLPGSALVPKNPVRAIAFSRVVSQRPEVLDRLRNRGSAILLVLDDDSLNPQELELDGEDRVFPMIPVLPPPLGGRFSPPEAWKNFRWGALLGLFPFPGSREAVKKMIDQLHGAGAGFVLTAPLLLTPKDRHRILETYDGSPSCDELENALFHADIFRGFRELEKDAGLLLEERGICNHLGCLVPRGYDEGAVETAAMLRLWARRLDQSRKEASWGWRLRRAAAALEPLRNDPRTLSRENNLRVIPGFDGWVEDFTRALWDGGRPLEEAWERWTEDS